MNIWRYIGDWAKHQEIKAANRKLAKQRLTMAGLSNSLHSLSGEIGGYISDLGVLTKTLLEDASEKMQTWTDATLKLYESAMQNIVVGELAIVADEAEKRAARRQNHIMNYIVGLAKYMENKERNNADRYNAVMERIAQMSQQVDNSFNVIHGTQVALFMNLTEQIQAKQRVVTVYKSEPTLEWLLQRPDELIYLGRALETLKNNDRPPKEAEFEVVRGLRSLMPCENSIIAIQEAVHDVSRQFGVAA